jgi:hypothetical protein
MSLFDVLKTVSGAKIVSLVVETVPDMITPKANPLFGRLVKRSYINGMIGFRYENSVNNQLAREGVEADFVSHPRKWGNRIEGTPLVEHKGTHYLEVKIEKVYDTKYILDGKEVSKDVVAQHLRPAKEGSGRQGTEKAVILRDYKLDSITALNMGGRQYLNHS